MKKFSALLVLVLLFVIPAFSCENDTEIHYPPAENSIEWSIDQLLEDGEHELLTAEFLEARKKFSEAIDLCSRTENQSMRLARALFDRSIANIALQSEQDSFNDLSSLKQVVKAFQCEHAQRFPNQNYFAYGKPILGPEEISANDCLSLVSNTTNYIKEILALAPISSKWKVSAISALHLIEQEARQCCLSGGVWKACVQPLFHKWLELKDWDRECRNSGSWLTFPYWE